jgi:methionine synthase II (cobalamin-independent)
MKINGNMLIEDIVEKYPETIGPLQEMGIQCIRCGEPVWGTLEEKISEKGLDNPDKILERLNREVNEKIKD